MPAARPERKSLCSLCGTRLSTKASSGEVKWQKSHIDDAGIICQACYIAQQTVKAKAAKNRNRTT